MLAYVIFFCTSDAALARSSSFSSLANSPENTVASRGTCASKQIFAIRGYATIITELDSVNCKKMLKKLAYVRFLLYLCSRKGLWKIYLTSKIQ